MRFFTAIAALMAVAAAAPVNVLSVRDEPLFLMLANNFDSSVTVNCYITGSDASGKHAYVKEDGTLGYPDPNAPDSSYAKIPLPTNGKTIPMPDFINSARIYFAEGDLVLKANAQNGAISWVEPSFVDPNDPNHSVKWGFVEFNHANRRDLFLNLSFVDFVGLPLAIEMTSAAKGKERALGLHTTAVDDLCNSLSTMDPFSNLCVTDAVGQNIRVLAPQHAENFDDYYAPYLEQVWSKYSNEVLTIDTLVGGTKIACHVVNDVFQCDGDSRTYAKPPASDIMGCQGILGSPDTNSAVQKGVIPSLCAALNRATLLLTGGETQPSLGIDQYYPDGISNKYSQEVHKLEIDGKGYAFPYDDITPAGPGSAVDGSMNAPDAISFKVTVGGPKSS